MIHLDEEPAIVVRKLGPASHLASQNHQLMSEHRILRLKPTKGSLVSGSISPSNEGHRRRFSATDKRQILEEAMRLGARLSAVARRCGIAGRVLFRWKQE